MELVFLWPGQTKNPHLRALQEDYLARLRLLGRARIVETAEARGLKESAPEKIMEREAERLEKHLEDGYIICLSDKGKMMTSEELARLIDRQAMISARRIIFLVGGFLGLASRLLDRADLKLSLSPMTFSHELTRVVLLEQVYRAINLIKGYAYPK
ncbi:MAG: 23S rRNA (pseudouridine(1915)-N(3))-methyltransferase RlmH [Candidatus Saccharicenans sp.]|jgi:23S rRNA (pseudouridine1915-N3)-methyltransferase|nr:23S rRNA (pseudouridine(1915)-N(3))-methyltransferase RlmH [Candidatus Saccharicenans sp.]MDH7492932.1 23S rRNA (pseudouridine(1915)-N(3))-methyltransferase RlmH [Candidatus Saccharicenans sp.]